MSKICLHCYISGQVQGIGYRANARREAIQLDISGWVKNLDDGGVEALLCGEAENVHKLVSWMYRGPAGAVVDAVVTEPRELEDNLVGFEVR